MLFEKVASKNRVSRLDYILGKGLEKSHLIK